MREDLEWIDVTDFSPGIYDDWFAATGQLAAVDGAAQAGGTWGCVVDQTGTLIPAPRVSNGPSAAQGLIDAGAGGSHYLAGDVRMHVLAFGRQVALEGNPTIPSTERPDMVWACLDWFYNSAGTGPPFANKVRGRGYKEFLPTVSTYDAISGTGTAFASTQIIRLPAFIGNTRVHPTTPTSPGEITTDLSVTFRNSSTTYSPQNFLYPNPSTPGVDSVVASVLGGWHICCHQGRIIALSTYRFYGAFGYFIDDLLTYTNRNRNTTSLATVVFAEEAPFPIGVIESVNASELLVVKQRGGGYVMRGDIVNPKILRLPSLASTGLGKNYGTFTPEGFVYGSDQGVWLWTGGDVSQHISTQLQSWFWKCHDDQAKYWMGSKGTFEFVFPFVFTPNGYLFDIRHRSWFRLANPSVYQFAHYKQSGNSRYVYGAPPFVTGSAPYTHVYHYIDMDQGANSYQWYSQPLARTRGRVHDFREIVLVAQGNGTVTVELVGINGATSGVITFTVSSTTRPVVIAEPVSVKTHDVETRVVSTGSGGGAAPRIHRMHFGYVLKASV